MTISKVISHPVIILALTIVSIAFFFSLVKSGGKTQNSAENIRILEHEVNQISQEIIDVEERLDETESQQFKEKVVRNELLLQKPGEYVLQLSDVKKNGNTQNCDSVECHNTIALTQKPVILAWKDLLF